ncbi:MAG: LuxR C-terminal-related transcriptional regulator [Chloroflexota bacterium]
MSSENELSEREKEILKLVATGASNKEIAQALYISPNTVKVHLRNIFAKIGVVSRTEATLYAIKIGLIPESVREEINQLTTAESNTAVDAPAAQEVRSFSIKGGGVVVLLIVILIAFGFFRMSQMNERTVNPMDGGQRWSQLAELPEGVGGAVTERYEGFIYLFGGEHEGELSGDVFAYDLIQNEWQRKAEKPTFVSGVQAGVLGEKIYLPGGKLADGTITTQVEMYDPRNDEWGISTPLPLPLTGYGLAVFEGRLYLFGGWDGNSFRDEVLVFDPDVQQWEVQQKMPSPRAFLAAAMVGNKIYLIGGEDAKGVTADCVAFYPNREKDDPTAWEQKPPLPQGRKDLRAAVLADGVYVASGVNQIGQPVTDILRFNETSAVWEVLEPPPLLISADTALAASQTRLHLLGGTIGMRTAAYHQAYQAIYTVVLPAVSR